VLHICQNNRENNSRLLFSDMVHIGYKFTSLTHWNWKTLPHQLAINF